MVDVTWKPQWDVKALLRRWNLKPATYISYTYNEDLISLMIFTSELLKFTCVFLVMPKPMNLSSNWGVSALATYRGSYLKMYFSTLSLKVSNHVVGGCLDISLVCCVKLWSLP